jgi:low affinity Fe/Cu permease
MQTRQQASTDQLDTIPDTTSPAYAKANPVMRAFDSFASLVTRWAGSPYAFGFAVTSIVVWVVTGPIFHYSDGWQLVINTGTTIVTFLMVFLIQQSQNKDSVALHLKLNELLASHRRASNQLIGIEDASEEELRRLAAAYLRLAAEGGANAGKGRSPACDVAAADADAETETETEAEGTGGRSRGNGAR